MGKAKIQENNEAVLSLLQAFVDKETESRNLYWSRSVFWRNLGFKKLAEYYLQQSEEDHAQRSADRLAFLGGSLGISPQNTPPLDDKESISDMYLEDLYVEIQLADRYAEAIKLAETELDWITANTWKGVLTSTQEHIAFLQQELAQISRMGEDNYLSLMK